MHKAMRNAVIFNKKIIIDNFRKIMVQSLSYYEFSFVRYITDLCLQVY